MKKEVYKNYPNPILWEANTRSVSLNGILKAVPINKRLIAGTLISVVAEENVLVSGKIYATVSSSTTIKLHKEHGFGIGGEFFDGTNQLDIISINTSDADYDTFILSAVTTMTANSIAYGFNYGTDSDLVVLSDTLYFGDNDTTDVNVTITDSCILNKNKMPDYCAVNVDAHMIKTVAV